MGYSTIIFDTIWVFLLSLIYALIEIELEGKHGWAKNLPTAHKFIGHFTLYHIYMMLYVVLTFSGWFFSRFFLGCMSGWNIVFHFLFFVFSWFLIEDFLWFVFNPYYTIKNYSKKHIPWHNHWIGNRIPMHNLLGLLFLMILAVANWNGELWLSLAISGVLIFFCIVFAPVYHAFYVSTHHGKH